MSAWIVRSKDGQRVCTYSVPDAAICWGSAKTSEIYRFKDRDSAERFARWPHFYGRPADDEIVVEELIAA